jgi:tetratricopeptide (TPR) repeat protein
MSRYFAFISYSHQDETWAKWLHKSLESYRPPKRLVGVVTPLGEISKRISRVFRDREELASATDLGEVIRTALSKSERLVVICSPSSACSRWVNEEILVYKRLGREDRIFCLIVDGVPNAPDPELECFPQALRFEIAADGSTSDNPSEPIAADVRADKDGRSNARLKLLAGMLGVGYDDLRRREQHRRHRRMAAIASASVLGMIITTGLTTAALFARAEADRQRVRAEAETETARQTTNFLVGLFEVSDPSEARGNTVTAREILDLGAQRIGSELFDQPAVQATLMDTIGTVYKSLGLYQDAQTLLERALLQRRGLLGDRHADVARSLSHLAEVLSLRADYDAAEALYVSALEQQRALLGAGDPEVAEVLMGLAEVLTEKGRYEAAEPLLREALVIRRAVFGEQHLAIASSLENLGLNLFDQGRHSEAESVLRRAVAMQRKLVDEGPHPQLADGISNLGYLLWMTGQYEEAERLWTESLEMNRVLLGDVHPTIAAGLNNLALLLSDRREYRRAEQMFVEVIAMRRQVLGNEHPDVAGDLGNLARLYFDMGRREEAFQLAYEALEVYRAAYTETDHPDIALMLTNLGGWSSDVRDLDAAVPLLEEGLAMQARLLGAGHPDNAYSMAPLAQVYVAVGRYEKARELAAEAQRLFAEALPQDHWRTAWATGVYAASLAGTDDWQDAEALLLESYRVLRSSTEARPSAVVTVRGYLFEFYTRQGDLQLADTYRSQSDL